MCLCKYNVQYSLGDQPKCSCYLPFHLVFHMTLKKRRFWFSYYRLSTSWFIIIMLVCFLRLSSCPASFPYVFRVGTAWNGDLWSFSGFTSLVPSASITLASGSTSFMALHLQVVGWPVGFKEIWRNCKSMVCPSEWLFAWRIKPETSGSATADLWMVLLPLFQVDSMEDECQPWKGAGRNKAVS